MAVIRFHCHLKPHRQKLGHLRPACIALRVKSDTRRNVLSELYKLARFRLVKNETRLNGNLNGGETRFPFEKTAFFRRGI